MARLVGNWEADFWFTRHLPVVLTEALRFAPGFLMLTLYSSALPRRDNGVV